MYIDFALKNATKQQEKLIFSLIDNMPGLVIFKDHEGHWLRANKTTLDLFQLNGIKYIGKCDSELAEHCNNPDALLHCSTTDIIAWNKGQLLKIEERVGNTYWEVQKQPVYKETRTKHGIIVMSKEITETKRVEQKLMDDFLEFNKPKKLFFDMGS